MVFNPMIPTEQHLERVAIIGSGYTGGRLADYCLARGARVRAFRRRINDLASRTSSGAEQERLDLDADIKPLELDGDLIYYLVPPSLQPGDERLKRFLEGIRGVPKRLIYLSTTGVYGDQHGALANEDTPPDPNTDRSSRRLVAEATLRAWALRYQVSWCILRVAGIYGPGRLPLERLLQGSPAIIPCEATPGNRIHVSDLVSVCGAAGLAARADRRIYNVTDGSPDSHTEFLQRVARICGLPLPPLVSRAEAEKTFSPLTWSFLADSRRVDNRRMLEELGVSLRYRDLDTGIRASLGDG